MHEWQVRARKPCSAPCRSQIGFAVHISAVTHSSLDGVQGATPGKRVVWPLLQRSLKVESYPWGNEHGGPDVVDGSNPNDPWAA